MPNLNKMYLMGNLVRDVELKYVRDDLAVVTVTVATTRKRKKKDGSMQEDTLYLDCTAFGRTAEIINQYCEKGKAVFLEGRLVLDEWEDKHTKAKRTKVKMMIENLQLLGHAANAGQPQAQPPPKDAPPAASPSQGPPPDDYTDDIPF